MGSQPQTWYLIEYAKLDAEFDHCADRLRGTSHVGHMMYLMTDLVFLITFRLISPATANPITRFSIKLTKELPLVAQRTCWLALVAIATVHPFKLLLTVPPPASSPSLFSGELTSPPDRHE